MALHIPIIKSKTRAMAGSPTHGSPTGSMVPIDDKKDVRHVEAAPKLEYTMPKALDVDIDPDILVAAAVRRSQYADLTPWETIKFFRRQFLLGASVGVGAAYVSYCQSGMSVVVANKGFIQQFGTVHTAKGLQLNAQYVSIWGAALNATTAVFHAASPLVVDRFGRKFSFYILTTTMLAAILLDIFAKDWKVFTVAKVMAGLSGGFNSPCIMTYMSEVARPQYRGIMMSAAPVFLDFSAIIVAVVNEVVAIHTPLAYRRVFYSEFFMLGVWAIPLLLLPESPVWLVTKGRDADAKKAYKRLVGQPSETFDFDLDFDIFRDEVHLSEAVTRQASENDWRALFKRDNLRRAIAASLPFAAQQLCGLPYIGNYTTYFFQIAGVKDPFLGNLILTLISFVFVVLSLFTIDRFGRRGMCLWALVILGIINIIIGALSWIKASNSAGGGALVAMCALFKAVFSFTLNPAGWVSIAEVSSVRLRAKTAAFSVTVNVILNLIFTYTVPLLLSDQDAGWGQKIGFFFGGLCFLTWPPMYFLYPETKGRTINELDELYERHIPPRKFHKTATTMEMQLESQEPAVA